MKIPARSFDRLAGIYRTLEYIAFGRDLERARFAHLDLLRNCRSLLVLGEGDGRCLARLVQIVPHAHIDCLDSSAAMLARAEQRLAGTAAAGWVNFHRVDAVTVPLPAAHYDGAITLFFLDCFTAGRAEELVRRINASLRPGSIWLWADFAEPPRGWRRWRAHVWLAVMYTFFRWQTGLETRRLPPVERLFAETGWRPLAELTLQHGLLRSAAFRRLPGGKI
jgi:ubiquinone/menaquinone biosynthesis C-methylase UbiE